MADQSDNAPQSNRSDAPFPRPPKTCTEQALEDWLQDLDVFFLAKNVPPHQRVPLILSHIRNSGNNKLKAFCTQAWPFHKVAWTRVPTTEEPECPSGAFVTWIRTKFHLSEDNHGAVVLASMNAYKRSAGQNYELALDKIEGHIYRVAHHGVQPRARDLVYRIYDALQVTAADAVTFRNAIKSALDAVKADPDDNEAVWQMLSEARRSLVPMAMERSKDGKSQVDADGDWEMAGAAFHQNKWSKGKHGKGKGKHGKAKHGQNNWYEQNWSTNNSWQKGAGKHGKTDKYTDKYTDKKGQVWVVAGKGKGGSTSSYPNKDQHAKTAQQKAAQKALSKAKKAMKRANAAVTQTQEESEEEEDA
jgi:hypothetical protein